jgi:dTDP-4-amino-4,6-dideoxygalactose transaminase
MEPILDLASKHSLAVIEDAAQSLSAEYTCSNGSKKKAGTMGTIGTTSFFPSKNLGCFGDGGALLTDDKDLAERIKMIANHGQKVKYHHEVIGINSRLDTLQAAVLNVKLKYLNEYSKKRMDVASYYDNALSGLANIDPPVRVSYSSHVFHQYTIKIKNADRDAFRDYLSKEGIPSMIYYPIPLHFQNAFRRPDIHAGCFPVAEKLSKAVISLPIHTEMNEGQLEFICNRVKDYFR